MIAGLLLAAGGASRFGQPKQLASLEGRPLIEHALDPLLATPALDRVVVVLGAEAARVRSEADLSEVDVVVAEDWAEGIAASLRAGLAALGDASGALITLADQPRITTHAIAAVLSRAGDTPAVRASYDGQPGHPVYIGRELFAEIATLRGDVGARRLLEKNGVLTVPCDELAGGEDIDTPADLDAMAG
jgi:CTP:molybdopterin cytidylyltransferase MocA